MDAFGGWKIENAQRTVVLWICDKPHTISH
jgi:hypothetical protein